MFPSEPPPSADCQGFVPAAPKFSQANGRHGSGFSRRGCGGQARGRRKRGPGRRGQRSYPTRDDRRR